MRYVPLPNGGPSVSVLGLGCAAMMGSAGRRESLRALHGAFDAGINFFDTARSYGYGASEGLLGEFCAGRRDRVVLCTKFGILPAPKSWKQAIKPLGRGVLKLFPGLRIAARKQAGQLFTGNQFSVDVLRSSLETSLRELRTDYVDILLMHAAPLSVLAQDDLLAELERLVSEGKVRIAGISGEFDVISAALTASHPALQTAQFACNLDNITSLNLADVHSRSGAQAAIFMVGNHPFGGATGIAETRRRISALHADPALSTELRAKIDPADPQLLPEVVLNSVLNSMLDGNRIDAVVAAMIQPRHLKSNCRAISECRFTPAELFEIRSALAQTGARQPAR